MTSLIVKPFESIINNQSDLLKKAAEGEKFIGYFCTYTPIEIIHASGFIPIRISGGTGIVENTYNLLPDFVCPFMKRSMEKFINGEYDFLSGVVQGYSCDAACGVMNVMELNFKNQIFEILPLPYNNSDAAKNYYRSTILGVIEKLNNIGGNFSEKKLSNSIKLYNKIRKILNNIYALRYSKQLSLTSKQLLLVIQAGFVICPEEYLDMLEKLMIGIEIQKDECQDKKRGEPLLISGSLIESYEFINFIEKCGADIVADDLCNGIRSFYPVKGYGHDPFEIIIDRLINKFPCPSRSSAEERLPEIMNLISQSGAKAVIFIIQKYCTPHLSDFPFLSKELKKAGINNMIIEVDETWKTKGQLQTRVEGFIEMLEMSK